MLAERLEELLVVTEIPLVEASLQHGVVLILKLLWHQLKAVNHPLDLLGKGLHSLKVVVELELVDSLNLD